MVNSRSIAPLLLFFALLTGCGTGPSENAALVQECVVPNATVTSARTPVDHPLQRAGQALLYQYPANHYALLEMPGCKVTMLSDVPERVGLGDVFILPGGTRVFPTSLSGRAEIFWWYARDTQTAPMRIEFLPDKTSPYSPVLSNDGQWLAWLRYVKSEDESHYLVAIRRPDGKDEKLVELTSLEPAMYELLGVDVAAQELTLVQGLNEFIGIGFDGRIRWRLKVSEVAAQSTTFYKLNEGYFAWDAVRDEGSYRIAWTKSSRSESHEFERLRQIQHAAVDPSGRYAAVSLETKHGRALSLRDAVIVVRLSDHKEIFRKYFPKYNRSEVAFLTDRYFAYSEGNQVRVVRLP